MEFMITVQIGGEDVDADVRDLIAAGSSLGGARPKASVRDGMGRLCIAKFPKPSDTDDVSAWEYVALQIARLAGICVPDFRLVRFGGRSILLLDRFDRSQAGRVPHISGLTAVQGRDGGSYSYLELVEFIEEHGSSPMYDLHELWKQMLLTCALGNTDNHLRNYGFLHDGKGWRLSPAFDVNPTQGDFDKSLSTAIDFDVRDADPRAAFDVREYFRLSAEEARHIASQTANVVARWKGLARKAGIDSRSVKEMSSCFECGERRLSAQLGRSLQWPTELCAQMSLQSNWMRKRRAALWTTRRRRETCASLQPLRTRCPFGGRASREALLFDHVDNLHPVLDVFARERVIEVEGDNLILDAYDFCGNGLDISRGGPSDVLSYGKVFSVGDFVGGEVL